MYGEGRQHAHQRLYSEIEKQLHPTPPYKSAGLQHPINQWIVPFERNTRFTGRESELAELEKKIFTNNHFKTAVCGLGGVGKTQLVLEFLYKVKQKNKDCSKKSSW